MESSTHSAAYYRYTLSKMGGEGIDKGRKKKGMVRTRLGGEEWAERKRSGDSGRDGVLETKRLEGVYSPTNRRGLRMGR